jgi:hypothetical protein
MLIVAWAAWLARAYLDVRAYTWPAGGEWDTATRNQTNRI